MGQALGCLAVLVAVVAAALRWDLPSSAVDQARVDAEIQRGITFLTVRRLTADPDNSPSGTAEAPRWMRRTAGQLERAFDTARFTLKDRARKSILGRVTQ